MIHNLFKINIKFTDAYAEKNDGFVSCGNLATSVNVSNGMLIVIDELNPSSIRTFNWYLDDIAEIKISFLR